MRRRFLFARTQVQSWSVFEHGLELAFGFRSQLAALQWLTDTMVDPGS